MSWRLGHRPSLDGLRGVAIGLVLLGHLQVPGLDAGGWTGVTLFFALSGFLITALLLEERADTGHISLRAFYARRGLRLLPALAVFLVVTGAVRVAQGDPNTSRDALAVTLYFANWIQILLDEGLGIVGHTWSLAVEEQYYLLWPALLIVLLAFVPRRPALMFAIVLVGAFASFGLRLALYGGHADYTRVYMATDTRADALLAGSALAIWFHFRGSWRPPRWAALLAAGGLLLLSAGPPSQFEPELVRFGLAAATVSATVLIAYAAAHGARILDLGPLRGAGRVSYALYLWHVPAIAWTMAATVTIVGAQGPGRLIGLGLAVLLAVMSYRYVEKPFLRLKSRFRWRIRDPGRRSESPGTENLAPVRPVGR